jgi:hypothetical protein
MTRWQSRVGVAAVALTLNIGFGLILIAALETERRKPPRIVFTGFWTYSTPHSSASKTVIRPKGDAHPKVPGVVAPLEGSEDAGQLPQSAPSEQSPNAPIDWSRAAIAAAQGIVNEQKPQVFGELPDTEPTTRRRPAPEHYAGESYQDALGNTLVWLSDHCYIVSELSRPGVADYMKGGIPTTQRCIAKHHLDRPLTLSPDEKQHELP